MAEEYMVKQGDCIESIAFRRGLLRKKIWNVGANTALKTERKGPNVPLLGDKLTIPPIQARKEADATEQRHVFRWRDVPSKMKLRFLTDDHKPRANEPHALQIEGELSSGALDVEIPILRR